MFASSCLYRSQKKGFYWCCCLRALADLTAARCAQIFQIVSLSVATCWQVKEQLELWEEVRRYRIHFMELWFTTELHRVITQCDNTAVSSWSHPEVQIVFTFLIFLLLLFVRLPPKMQQQQITAAFKSAAWGGVAEDEPFPSVLFPPHVVENRLWCLFIHQLISRHTLYIHIHTHFCVDPFHFVVNN